MGALNSWMHFALKKCHKSTHHKYKMVAVLVKGGRVISWAANRQNWGAHAELRAIVRARDPKGSTLYVVRNKRRSSKPCADCHYLITQKGIKRVVYLDESGEEDNYSL